jgi:hypothetical protein
VYLYCIIYFKIAKYNKNRSGKGLARKTNHERL